MSKINHDYYPKIDDIKFISYLPRDIRLGANHKTGELLCGWCWTTNTFQLWRCIDNNKAKFIGYISNNH
jgi:hypothetical protein